MKFAWPWASERRVREVEERLEKNNLNLAKLIDERNAAIAERDAARSEAAKAKEQVWKMSQR